MKKVIFGMLFSLFSFFCYSGIYVKNPVYELTELELTDSLPIMKIDSIFKINLGYSLFDAYGPKEFQLDISVSEDGVYIIILTHIQSVQFANEPIRIGVFDYRDKSFYVKNGLIPDFLQKSDRKRKFDWRTDVFKAKDGKGYDYPRIPSDTPIFKFRYKSGDIELIGSWL